MEAHPAERMSSSMKRAAGIVAGVMIATVMLAAADAPYREVPGLANRVLRTRAISSNTLAHLPKAVGVAS